MRVLDRVGIEIKMELWSEEPTGLRTETLGRRGVGENTRSMIEGEPEGE